MRILHTSDLHLGKIVNDFSMIEDQKYILNEIINIIKVKKIDILIISGDVYDRTIPPKEAVNLLDSFINELIINLNVKIMMISGNHDGGSRLNFASNILEKSGLYIAGSKIELYKKVSIDNVDFYLIPFNEPFVLKKMYDENIKDYNDAMEYVINEIKKEFDEKKVNIAIAHGYVGKYSSKELNYEDVGLNITSSERPLAIGGTDIISSELFEMFDYTALGHLHGKQQVGNTNIRYSGSPLKYSFSEIHQKKGVYILGINKEKNDYKCKVDFLPLHPLRDIRDITGTIDDILLKGVSDKNKQDYVRVILTDKGEILNPMEKIRTVFPNAMSVAKEIDLYDSEEVHISESKNKRLDELFEEYFAKYKGEYTKEHKKVVEDVLTKISLGGENETY